MHRIGDTIKDAYKVLAIEEADTFSVVYSGERLSDGERLKITCLVLKDNDGTSNEINEDQKLKCIELSNSYAGTFEVDDGGRKLFYIVQKDDTPESSTAAFQNVISSNPLPQTNTLQTTKWTQQSMNRINHILSSVIQVGAAGSLPSTKSKVIRYNPHHLEVDIPAHGLEGMSCICTHCTLINCVWISIVFISVGSIYIKASNETEDDYYHEDEDNNSNGSGVIYIFVGLFFLIAGLGIYFYYFFNARKHVNLVITEKEYCIWTSFESNPDFKDSLSHPEEYKKSREVPSRWVIKGETKNIIGVHLKNVWCGFLFCVCLQCQMNSKSMFGWGEVRRPLTLVLAEKEKIHRIQVHLERGEQLWFKNEIEDVLAKIQRRNENV